MKPAVRPRSALPALLLALPLLALAAGPASAATYVIDVGTDTHDASPGNGACADATGHCSLRAAIEEGNASAGDHVINFTPGIVVTVGAFGSLPSINAKVVVNGNLATIDGQYVQGSSIGYGCLSLLDSGTAALGHANGAAGSTVMNLSIVRCNGDGISSNGHGYTYLNNRIGVDPTGLVAMPNSGNGIRVTASAYYPDTTTLQGIYDLLPPSLQPVDFSKIHDFQVSLTNALLAVAEPVKVIGNVLSGNDHYGLEIHGTNMAAVFVSGNHIGTDVAGATALPNGWSGVRINATSYGNMIGPDNVISGNAQHGILVDAGTVLLPNFVMGNRIGLGDVPGVHVGNGQSGIWVDTKPAGVSDGTPNPSGTSLVIGPTNVVSDNKGTNNDPWPDDVSAEANAGIVITGSSAKVKVLGNLIGVAEFPKGTADPSAAYGNAGDGILVTTSDNVIGGSAASDGNVVAANLRHGIVVKGSGTTGIDVRGNSIGLSPSFAGQTNLGNGVDGIHLDRASASAFGGGNAGDGNVVAYNSRNGIALRNGSSSSGWANLMQRNRVYGNGKGGSGVGIDLEHPINAPDDPSRSEYPANYANGDQVPPRVCTGAADTGACSGSLAPASAGGATTVDWTLATHAGATFRVELYSVNAASANAATGASFIGEASVTTDATGSLVPASGNTTCTGSLPGRCRTTLSADAGGSSLLLNVTDVTALPAPGSPWYGALACFVGLVSCPANNTSELSNAVAVPLPAGPVMATVPAQSGKVGQPFTLDLNPYVNPNGSPITNWAVTSGALPTGLALGATGVISQTPTVAGSFSAKVDATNANGTTHAPAISFTIAKGDQTIAFGPAPALVAGGATKTVTATATSTLPVTFSSTTPTVCTATAAGVVTPLLVGTCTIAADQAGNASWNAAPRALLSIPVTAVAGPPPSWTGLPATQNAKVGVAFSLALVTHATENPAGDPILSYAVSSGPLPAGLGLDTSIGLVSGTPTAAATTSVSFTVSDKDGPSAAGTVQFVVARGDQTIGFGALANRTFGAPPFPVSASATSGLAVTITSLTAGVCTISGGTVTLVAPGPCTLHAVQGGDANWNAATPVDRSFTVDTVPVTHFSVTGAPASTTAGTPFSVTVSALDAGNAVTTGYLGTVHFTSTDAAALLPANYAFTAADAGVRTFTGLALSTAGSRSVTATDTVLASVTGSTGSLTVAPGLATHLSVSAPANATAGASFTATVSALDAFGNVATGYLGTVHFTSTDGAATLPSDYAFTAADAGVHSFSGVVAKTSGARTLTATDTVTAAVTGTSAAIAVAPGAAASLSVAAPGSAGAGTPISVTVTARDAFANTATGYAGTIHFTSSDPGATLPANYTFTAGDAGVHTFTNGVTLTTGSRTATATDTGNASITGTSGTIVVASAGSTTALAGPASSVVGQTVTFTATVTPGGAGTPTGTVDVLDGAATLCAAAPLNGAAQATCVTSALSLGAHTLTAHYNGDATFAASTSPALAHSVGQAATTTTVTGHTPDPATTLQAIAVTVSVTVSGPGSGTPTGTITVSDGTGDSCTITLPATSCALSPTSAGAKTLTATYGGDASFAGSTSAGVAQGVTAVTTFSGPTATGTGTAAATLSGAGCTFTAAQFVAVAPLAPPPGTSFPHGLFSFRIGGCGAGGTATVKVDYPQALPAGAQYWKYGPTAGQPADHWYALSAGAPNNASLSGASATFTLVDGGDGDDDLAPNGEIVDQGGPGAPDSGPAAVIPALGPRGLLALAALVALAGFAVLKRLS